MDKKYIVKCSISTTIMIAISAVMVWLATADIINYALASMCVVVSLLLPVLLIFEGSAKKCKILVLMATLTALAVVGRWIFAWAPNVTLSTGIVILAGVSLGGVPGFVVGALTMFVSNMLQGQGLWTVWQMLAMGLIGLCASMWRKADSIILCIYAVLACFVYGLIMDISTFVTVYPDDLTWQRFLMVWGVSFYFDLAHAISTAVTVLLLHSAIVPTIRRRL